MTMNIYNKGRTMNSVITIIKTEEGFILFRSKGPEVPECDDNEATEYYFEQEELENGDELLTRLKELI